MSTSSSLRMLKVPQRASASTFGPDLSILPNRGTNEHIDRSSGPMSPFPLASEHSSHSMKPRTCPLCKGKKYEFTAYFHNANIFSEPPHELLSMIEESYLLRNRLKSLFVTYGMRVVERDQLQEAECDITAWYQQVGGLITEVDKFAIGSSLDLHWLERVQAWAKQTASQLREKISTGEIMALREMRMNQMLLEYRKLWENVWKGYLNDERRNSSTEFKESNAQAI